MARTRNNIISRDKICVCKWKKKHRLLPRNQKLRHYVYTKLVNCTSNPIALVQIALITAHRAEKSKRERERSVCVRAREVLPPPARESRASIIKRWSDAGVRSLYKIHIIRVQHIPCFNTSNSSGNNAIRKANETREKHKISSAHACRQ